MSRNGFAIKVGRFGVVLVPYNLPEIKIKAYGSSSRVEGINNSSQVQWLWRAVMVQPELSNRVCMTAIGDPQTSEIKVLLGVAWRYCTCSDPVQDAGMQGSQGRRRFMFGLPHHAHQ